MNAEHSAQLRLLDVQAADTAVAQLAHRRKSLPELAALTELAQQDTDLHNALIDAETALADITDEQRRLDNEVDAVRARATRDEQRMQAGGLPGKELESLQHELTTLARRQSSLEDDLLDVMERQEQADGEVESLRGRRAALSAERADLESVRDAAFVAIDAAVTERAAERVELAAGLPDELMALYEKAREHGGGSGASMLRQRRCEGCHIELSGSELAAVRAAADDEVVRCDNCRRILVRTAESGL
ncbi:MAG: C4-type zinc ribbon domain-containing protein [Jatrophihabitantaceae bacterium]